MYHLPPRSARQFAVTWRPRPARRPGRRPGGCRVEVMEPRVLLSVSVFDETFGNAGRSTFDLYGYNDTARQVLALPDGKILVGISASTGLVAGQPYDAISANGPGALARLNADGTLDESFSGDGFTDAWFNGKAPADASADRPVVSISQVAALAAQPDGKVLAAVSGSVDWMTPSGQASGRVDGGMSYFTVARFLPDGSLDLDFGNNGLAMAAPRGELARGHQTVNAIALQPDGRIVAVGRAAPAQGSSSADGDVSDWAVIRFNADGSTDSTFAQVIEDFPNLDDGRQSADVAQAVAVAPDGKILVGGVRSGHPSGSGTRFALVRYNPDGTKDASFGDAGRVSTHFPLIPVPDAPNGQASPASLEQLHLAPDGKVVATGRLGLTHLALARYAPDGMPDLTFGNGTGSVATPALSGGVYDARLRPDGGIDVAGAGGAADLFTVTFGPNGSVERTSSASGVAPAGTVKVWAVDVQPDGKVLGAGVAYPTADAGEGVAHEQTGDALVFRVDPTRLPNVLYANIGGDGGGGGGTPIPPAPTPPADPTPGGTPPEVDALAPVARMTSGRSMIRGGRAFAFKLKFEDAAAAPATPVEVTGPNNFRAEAQLLKVKKANVRGRAAGAARPGVASYRFNAPGGSFDASENGAYGILATRVVATPTGSVTYRRAVGQFTVAAPQRRTAAARPAPSSLHRLNGPAVRQDVLRTDSGSGASAAAVELLAAR